MYTKTIPLSKENQKKLIDGKIVIIAGTESLARQILASEKDGHYPEGEGKLFIFDYDGSTVGIDNTNGEAWTEEFSDYETCLAWLCGQFNVGDKMDEDIGDVVRAVKQDWEDTKQDFRDLKNAPKKALKNLKNAVADFVSGKKFNVKFLRKLLRKACKTEKDTVRIGFDMDQDDIWYFILADEPKIKVWGVGDKQRIRRINPKDVNYASGTGGVKAAQKKQKKNKFKPKKRLRHKKDHVVK